MSLLLPDSDRFLRFLRLVVRQEVVPLLDQLEQENMPIRWQGRWVSGRSYKRGDLVRHVDNVWLARRDTDAIPVSESSGKWDLFAMGGVAAGGSLSQAIMRPAPPPDPSLDWVYRWEGGLAAPAGAIWSPNLHLRQTLLVDIGATIGGTLDVGAAARLRDVLQVDGLASLLGSAELPDGSLLAPALRFTSSPQSGLAFAGGQFLLGFEGQARFRFGNLIEAGAELDMALRRIINLADPTDDLDAVHKRWVEELIASSQQYQGLWQVALNIPDLNVTRMVPVNGDAYYCVTADPLVGEQPPVVIPGLTGLTIYNGDKITWNGAAGQWERILGGSLTIDAARALFVEITGDAMTGFLTLPALDPTQDWHATPKKWVDDTFVHKVGDTMTGHLLLQRTTPGNGITPYLVAVDPAGRALTGIGSEWLGDAAGGQPEARLIFHAANGPGGWQPFMRSRIELTTPESRLALAGDPIDDLDAATKRYVDTAIGVTGNYVLKTGDTMTGALVVRPAPASEAIRVEAGVMRFINGGAIDVQPDAAGTSEVRANWHVSVSDPGGFGFGTTAQDGGMYKRFGGGLVLRQSSGNQQPRIELNDGSAGWNIIDQRGGELIRGQDSAGVLILHRSDSGPNPGSTPIYWRDDQDYLGWIFGRRATDGTEELVLHTPGNFLFRATGNTDADIFMRSRPGTPARLQLLGEPEQPDDAATKRYVDAIIPPPPALVGADWVRIWDGATAAAVWANWLHLTDILVVDGLARLRGSLELPNGALDAPALRFATSPRSGFGFAGAGVGIVVDYEGQARFRIADEITMGAPIDMALLPVRNVRDPVDPTDAVNRRWVENFASSIITLQGTWQVASNAPDITQTNPVRGHVWLATTVDPAIPERVPIPIPDLTGRDIHQGDLIVWSEPLGAWELLSGSGGGLTVDQANALYVSKAGDIMTGFLTLPALDPTQDWHAAPKKYVDDRLAVGFVLKSGDTMTGGLGFGSVAVATPGDLSRHLALWGTTFGFSITSGRLNYNVGPTNSHVFVLGDVDRFTMTNALFRADVPQFLLRNDAQKYLAFQRANGTDRWRIHSGNANDDTFAVEALTNVGTRGNVFTIDRQGWTASLWGTLTITTDNHGIDFNSGGKLYKASGSGMVLRQSSGNQQPQIENNNGTGRRAILDTNGGVIGGGDLWMDRRNFFLRGNNGNGVDLPYVSWVDGSNRTSGRIYVFNSGFNISPESLMRFQTSNGGWSYHTKFETKVSSQGAAQVCAQFFGQVSGVAFINSSSRAIKSNIRPIDQLEAAAIIARLQPVNFHLNADGEPIKHWGFVAEDVEEVMPTAVSEWDESSGEETATTTAASVKRKGYSPSDLLAVAVAEIQRLGREIAELKLQVAELRRAPA